jgi:putative flippase GtrA
MRHLPRTFARFATVGVVNTLIDLLLFWALVAPLGILAANVVSTSAGMAFSFVANGRHTFGATKVTGHQAVAFLATNAFTMWLLQPAMIVLTRALAGTPLLPAKMLALGASVVTNFLLYRYVVWPSGAAETPSTGSGAEAVGACAGAATEQLAARHERTESRGRIERAHG